MINNKYYKDYEFMGFDVRNVYDTYSSIYHNKCRLLSMDQSISERLINVNDSNNNEYQTVYGLYKSYDVSDHHFKTIDVYRQAHYEIIAIFLYKRCFDKALEIGYSDIDSKVPYDNAIGCLKTFEGYDIATLEYEWISFITNCRNELTEHMEKPIETNNVLLINTLERAMIIRNRADKVIPEHAPFGIWGIWSTK